MTQLEMARQGKITEEMSLCARQEGVEPEFIRQGVERGDIVVVRNINHGNIAPSAIGRGLRTKVNANLGTSRDNIDIELELAKVRVSAAAGADAIMDLSTGGDLRAIRKQIMAVSPVMVGTVPIYQAAAETLNKQKPVVEIDPEDMFRVLTENGEDGVDFITVHCGITKKSLEALSESGRLLGIVSRGGSITANWMSYNNRENPFYEQYDRLVEIARRYDMVLSLGDGLRPGCLADATDRSQVQELIILGELTKRARQCGVQVMIEGPGHVPLKEIEANVVLQKSLCDGAPFYVLGPLPTDIAPGYDHITSAIGGAIAGAAGADFLCYVTASEHLRLPNLADVREGVVTARLAAHIADIAKGVNGAWERNVQMARRRRDFDWEAQIAVSLDPQKARELLEVSASAHKEGCTMCGEFCAIKLGRVYRHV